MLSKLAAVLVAPLLVAMVWPAPQPPARSNSATPTASVQRVDAAATVPSSAWHGTTAPFKIMPASQAVETVPRGAPRLRFLTRDGIHGQSVQPAKVPLRTSRTQNAKAAPKVALYSNANSPGMNVTVNGPNTGSPSDSTGAIGPNHYVEVVNSAIAVYNRNNLVTPVSQLILQTWVGNPDPTTPYCDPQIQWDPSAGRWLYAFLFCNTASSSQDLHFGWSKTSDPSSLATGWCHYVGFTSPYLFDYPKLGHNSHYMLFGANAYDETVPSNNPPFSGSTVVWIKKPANTLRTCPAFNSLAQGSSPFPLRNGDGSYAFTPVPVNTTTSSGNGYVVASFDASSTPQANLAVWHVDSSGGWHAHADIGVGSFSRPAPAPQLGTSFVIDTLDGRLTQAVGDPITGIWTQHTVAGSGGRSIIRWYEIKVYSGFAAVAMVGYTSSPTDFLFNAAISPRADTGGVALIYNRSSATIYPLIAAQIRFTATPAQLMEPGEIVLASSIAADTDGTCDTPTIGTPCRWGDYAGASPDPTVKNVVWGTSQWNAATGAPPAWSTQNFALSFVTLPVAPTAVSASAGNGSATVSWTPNTYVPTPPVTSYTITAYVGPTATFTLVVAAPATTAYFTGLTNGTAYTFTVFATNSVGNSDESVHSNAVTPGRPTGQAPPTPEPGRTPVPQSSPRPSPSPPPVR